MPTFFSACSFQADAQLLLEEDPCKRKPRWGGRPSSKKNRRTRPSPAIRVATGHDISDEHRVLALC